MCCCINDGVIPDDLRTMSGSDIQNLRTLICSGPQLLTRINYKPPVNLHFIAIQILHNHMELWLMCRKKFTEVFSEKDSLW